jgi:hypothetical protein
MYELTTDQKQALLEIVSDSLLPAPIIYGDFTDLLHDLLDDIAGFETVSDAVRIELINELWSQHVMSKKPEKPVDPVQTEPAVSVQDDLASAEAVALAVTVGKEQIAAGATKAFAAWSMYESLNHLPREVVVKAFIEGAGLTEKGAMTYWYNCRRKAGRAKISSPS